MRRAASKQAAAIAASVSVVGSGIGLGLGKLVVLMKLPPPESAALFDIGPNGLVKYKTFEKPVEAGSCVVNVHFALLTLPMNASMSGAWPPAGEILST